MVVREGCADGHINIEPSRGSVEEEFGGGEGIVLMQLEQPKVKTSGVGALEVV